MKSTKIDTNIQRSLLKVLKEYPLVQDIVQKIDGHGGRALLVGGAVRDLLLSRDTKDIDIEVHKLTLEQLESILRTFGEVSVVGKSFGVLRLHGLDVDWSLPRADEPGRKPRVTIDPFMSITDAFARRDLTINAMGIDLVTFELIDPFNGHKDLQEGLLRAPNEKFFLEDPLRFFRVMQFIGRFEMYSDAQLNEICKKMDFSTVSVERIEEEFKKLLLKSARPSLGIRWLHAIGRLAEVLPELAANIGVGQDPHWHPEGDVFEHTMQTLDAMAQIPYDDPEKKLIMMYAALCHDLGKVTTTEEVNGRIQSLGHDRESALLAKKMLKRITRNKELITAVHKLVKYHMAPIQFIDGEAKLAAYKRLANKLAPEVTLQMLGDLALADKRGRNQKGNTPLTKNFPEVTAFLKKAQQAKVLDQVELSVLQGRDLLDVIEPGPKMGELLKEAYRIQLDEGVYDKHELKRRVLNNK